MEFPAESKLLPKWKAEYGDIFDVGGYIFRPMQIGEHLELELHKEWTAAECEDYIVKTTLLQPQFEDLEVKAGLISMLAEDVLNISGYGSDAKLAKKVLDDAREWAESITNIMKIFIIAAIPAYTDEDLDKYTFAQLAKKVALSEKIIEVRKGGQVLELIDPVEEAAKEKARIEKELANRKSGQAISTDPIAQKLRSALG